MILAHEEEQKRLIENEIETMQSLAIGLDSPVVQLIDANIKRRVGRSGWEAHLLMEYCPGGSLVDMMNRSSGWLSERDIIGIMLNVCAAIALLHSRKPFPIIHRDIKVGFLEAPAGNSLPLEG